MTPRLRRIDSSQIAILIVALTIVALGARFTALTTAAERKEKMAALSFDEPEHLVYQGEFSKLMLRGIDVLEMRFSAEQVPNESPQQKSADEGAPEAQKRPAQLRFIGEVTTKGWFGRLFNLRFKYRSETLVDAATRQALRTDKLDEQGERVRVSEAVFDRRNDEVTWTERDPRDQTRAPRVVTSDLGGAPHDVISALYYLRTQQLTVGREFELALSDSGAVYCVPVKVVEAKRLKTALGEVPAVRVDIGVFGHIIERKGSFSIWFTADERHLPVLARINSEFGTLDLKLKKQT